MYVKVFVVPGAKKEKIESAGPDGPFNVSVKEKAERNAANKRVLTLLSAFLRLPENKLKIVTGHRSRSKIVDVNIESGLSV
jgi:uncharacterized protein YggU (UPF0235/DUF167 family)